MDKNPELKEDKDEKIRTFKKKVAEYDATIEKLIKAITENNDKAADITKYMEEETELRSIFLTTSGSFACSPSCPKRFVMIAASRRCIPDELAMHACTYGWSANMVCIMLAQALREILSFLY